MAKALGVGGIFFRCKDPKAMRVWYGEALGLPVDEWGASLKFEGMPEGSFCQWSPFKADSDYFPAEQQTMFNLIVDDVAACLERVKEHGGTPVGEVTEEVYGTFGWFLDPEGRKVELWAPKPMPDQS